jgi:hypothetical protein
VGLRASVYATDMRRISFPSMRKSLSLPEIEPQFLVAKPVT